MAHRLVERLSEHVADRGGLQDVRARNRALRDPADAVECSGPISGLAPSSVMDTTPGSRAGGCGRESAWESRKNLEFANVFRGICLCKKSFTISEVRKMAWLRPDGAREAQEITIQAAIPVERFRPILRRTEKIDAAPRVGALRVVWFILTMGVETMLLLRDTEKLRRMMFSHGAEFWSDPAWEEANEWTADKLRDSALRLRRTASNLPRYVSPFRDIFSSMAADFEEYARWISMGFSPDPSKHPTDERLIADADRRLLDALHNTPSA